MKLRIALAAAALALTGTACRPVASFSPAVVNHGPCTVVETIPGESQAATDWWLSLNRPVRYLPVQNLIIDADGIIQGQAVEEDSDIDVLECDQ